MDFGICGRNWPHPWIRPENSLGKSEVKWLQKLPTECSELKVGQAPAAGRTHLEVELLCFQHRVLHQPIVRECNGDGVVERKQRDVLRGLLRKRPDRGRKYKNCQKHCEMVRFHHFSTWTS